MAKRSKTDKVQAEGWLVVHASVWKARMVTLVDKDLRLWTRLQDVRRYAASRGFAGIKVRFV